MATTGPVPAVMEAIGRGSAVVFFDVALGEGENAAELGRIKLELFVKDVRVGFIAFCRGPFSLSFLCDSVPRRVRTFDSSVLANFCRTNSRQATRVAPFIG